MLRLMLAAAVMGLAGAASADEVKIPLSVVEAGWKKADCDVELKDEERAAADLGRGLKLVEVYCWRAAYQAGSIFFAVDPKAPDQTRLLTFPTWIGKGKRLDTSHSLTSPEYDPKTKTLSMAHKGRGVGDCGDIGEWKWKGSDFVLVRFWSKPACDAKPFDETRRWQVYPPRR